MKNINKSTGYLIVLVFWTIVLTLLSTVTSNAQDTICTYFIHDDVYEFDYDMDTVMTYDEQTTRFYSIEVGYRQVLCLDLSDTTERVRRVIITYPDGSKSREVLDSRDKVYYTPFGPLKVEVGKPKYMILL